MNLISSPTELSTSVTDALLAIECLAIMAWLWRSGATPGWRTGLWCWAFGLMALSSVLGAVAHGFEMPGAVREALWKPLYLSLGVLIALFMVGAVHDWRGQAAARRLVPWAVAVGAAFFAVTEFSSGAFIVFIAYEAFTMLAALAIYSYLAATRRLRGAAVIAGAIVLNLVAAGVQASSVSIQFILAFDHNGVFHLVQMLATALLGLGLRMGMGADAGARRVGA